MANDAVHLAAPKAIRSVIPTIVGQSIALFKDTSLVYIIGMLGHSGTQPHVRHGLRREWRNCGT